MSRGGRSFHQADLRGRVLHELQQFVRARCAFTRRALAVKLSDQRGIEPQVGQIVHAKKSVLVAAAAVNERQHDTRKLGMAIVLSGMSSEVNDFVSDRVAPCSTRDDSAAVSSGGTVADEIVETRLAFDDRARRQVDDVDLVVRDDRPQVALLFAAASIRAARCLSRTSRWMVERGTGSEVAVQSGETIRARTEAATSPQSGHGQKDSDERNRFPDVCAVVFVRIFLTAVGRLRRPLVASSSSTCDFVISCFRGCRPSNLMCSRYLEPNFVSFVPFATP